MEDFLIFANSLGSNDAFMIDNSLFFEITSKVFSFSPAILLKQRSKKTAAQILLTYPD